jgi:hypothetical protein
VAVARAKHGTLSAGVAVTVDFTSSGGEIRVANKGTAGEIYFRLDGTAPVSLADDNYCVTPGSSVIVTTQSKQVKLISAGTPTYSVELY